MGLLYTGKVQEVYSTHDHIVVSAKQLPNAQDLEAERVMMVIPMSTEEALSLAFELIHFIEDKKKKATLELHSGLYHDAYKVLDKRDDLRRRGVSLELFMKVYTPEDCRAIIANNS